MQEQWNPVLASAVRGFMHRADPNVIPDPAILQPSADDVAGAQRMIGRHISSGSESYDSEEELEGILDRPEALDDEGAASAYELDFHACGVLPDVDSSSESQASVSPDSACAPSQHAGLAMSCDICYGALTYSLAAVCRFVVELRLLSGRGLGCPGCLGFDFGFI